MRVISWVRTQPLWLAQGFAVEILGAPNNTDHQIFTDLGGLSIETLGMVEGQP